MEATGLVAGLVSEDENVRGAALSLGFDLASFSLTLAKDAALQDWSASRLRASLEALCKRLKACAYLCIFLAWRTNRAFQHSKQVC